MKKLVLCFLLLASSTLLAQHVAPLTVEKIMRNPQWMGVSPSNVQWSLTKPEVYFNWNPERTKTDPLYRVSPSQRTPVLASVADEQALNRRNVVWNKGKTKAIFERNGDLYVLDKTKGSEKLLINTVERESNATFTKGEDAVVFQRGDNLFRLSLLDGSLTQLSGISRNRKRGEATLSKQDQWLKTDQLQTFDFLRQEEDNRKQTELERKSTEPKRPKEFFLDDKSTLTSIRISPDERFIAFRISRNPDANQNTIVPNYITTSGYVEDIPGRTKVGNALATYTSYIYDRTRDSIYSISTKEIPGIKDLPDYVKDYPKQLEERTKKNEDRKVSIVGPFWNERGNLAVVSVYALDNKDRWIMALDLQSGQLKPLDRQRDEAWIGGPGIGGSFGGGTLGWIDD